MFKDTKALQEYVAVSSAFNVRKGFEVQKRRAIANHIQPLLGSKLYSILSKADGSGTLSPIQEGLMVELRTVVANFAVLYDLPVKAVHISDGGINRMETADKPSAFRYQVNELKRSLAEAGFEATERALAYLEENLSDFPQWKASPLYTVWQRSFIRYSTEFSRYVNIGDSRMVFLRLRNAIQKVLDMELTDALGEPLMQELLDKLQSGELDGHNRELVTRLKPVLANFTAARVVRNPAELAEWTANGLRIHSATDESDLQHFKSPDPEWLRASATAYEQDAAAYQQRLMRWLNDNVGKYPAFKQSRNYLPPVKPKTDETDDTGAFFF